MGIIKYLKDFLTRKKQKITETTLENFDDVRPRHPSHVINGMHGKKFFRCDGKLFEPLYDELRKNPDSSYDTYLNELIIQNPDYIPTRVSAMFKTVIDGIGHNDGANREILASRIANFMGVPTVYNCAFDTPSNGTILSVDYMRYGEHILDLCGTLDNIRPEGEDDGYFDILFGHANLGKMLKMYVEALRFYKHYYNVNSTKLVNDFAKEFITRVHVLGDNDFGFHNFELSCDKDKNLRLMPMFDYEATFVSPNKQEIIRNIAYIKKYLPDFGLEKFNQRFAELVRPTNFKKLASGLDSNFAKSSYEFLKHQQSVFDSYTKYLDPENVKEL